MRSSLKERGFGLFETGIAMVVIIAIVAAAAMGFNHLKIKSDGLNTHSQILEVRDNIRKKLGNVARLPDLQDDALVSAMGLIPDHISRMSLVPNGTQFIDFWIRYEESRPERCLVVTSQKFGPDLKMIRVIRGNEPSAARMTPPVRPSPVATRMLQVGRSTLRCLVPLQQMIGFHPTIEALSFPASR